MPNTADMFVSILTNEKVIGAILSLATSIVAIKMKQKYDEREINKESKKEAADLAHLVSTYLEHPFFTSMDRYIENEIKHIDIEDNLKREVTIKFLTIKFTVFRDILKGLAVENAPAQKFHNAINSGVVEYENRARDAGIPEFFIRRFSDMHQSMISSVYENLASIIHAEIESNKIYIILYIYKMAFDMTFYWAQDIVDSMNGELHKALCKKCRTLGTLCGDRCLDLVNKK